MLTAEQIETVRNLLNKPYDFGTPFPMAVFGTLREGEGNNRLMRMNGTPSGIARAFLPNFVAVGISLQGQPGASAPFEIFHYEPEEWNKMISRVDGLEGFSFNGRHVADTWYLRTLAMLRILPDGDTTPFPTLRQATRRNLGIPQDQWENYQEIPCWIYSNPQANETSGAYPVIWAGDGRDRFGNRLEKTG